MLSRVAPRRRKKRRKEEKNTHLRFRQLTARSLCNARDRIHFSQRRFIVSFPLLQDGFDGFWWFDVVERGVVVVVRGVPSRAHRIRKRRRSRRSSSSASAASTSTSSSRRGGSATTTSCSSTSAARAASAGSSTAASHDSCDVCVEMRAEVRASF